MMTPVAFIISILQSQMITLASSIGASLTEVARVVIYDRDMFVIQATAYLFSAKAFNVCIMASRTGPWSLNGHIKLWI
jgi:hypothetical protein